MWSEHLPAEEEVQLRNSKFQLCAYCIHTECLNVRDICILMHMKAYRVCIIKSFHLIFVDAKHKIENFLSGPLFSHYCCERTFRLSISFLLPRCFISRDFCDIEPFFTVDFIFAISFVHRVLILATSKIDHTNIYMWTQCIIRCIVVGMMCCTVLEFWFGCVYDVCVCLCKR